MTALLALIMRDMRLAVRVGGGALMGALFFLILVTVLVAAHELGHVFIRRNLRRDLPPDVEEGFCNYLASLILAPNDDELETRGQASSPASPWKARMSAKSHSSSNGGDGGTDVELEHPRAESPGGAEGKDRTGQAGERAQHPRRAVGVGRSGHRQAVISFPSASRCSVPLPSVSSRCRA